mgnify:CR=1 FL=1
MSTLDALPVGSAAVIEALRAGRSLTVRLASLGLVPGERVRVLVNYGTGPVVVAVRGGRVAMIFQEPATSLNPVMRVGDQIVEAIAPQGQFALIDDPVSLDVTKLKRKSVSLHWELMFTRALFGTDDMIGQHRLLTEVAQLVDAGLIRTTLDQRFGTINAENLKRAHALIESGKARGKLVLEGWN